MKVIDYQGHHVRIMKGQIFAQVAEYYGGAYSRPRRTLALIEPEFFKNGNMKSGSFTVIKEIAVLENGYHYSTASFTGKSFKIIDSCL